MKIHDLLAERVNPITVEPEAEEFMNDVFYNQLESIQNTGSRAQLIKILNNRAAEFNIRFEVQENKDIRATTDKNGHIIIYLNYEFLVNLKDEENQDQVLDEMKSLVRHELVHREQAVRSKGLAFRGSDDEDEDPKKLTMAYKLSNPHEISAYADQIIAQLRSKGFKDRDIAQSAQYDPKILNNSNYWQLYQKTFAVSDPKKILNRLRKTIVDILSL